MKILVVENDPTSLKLTAEVLQMDGHVVMLAISADQAIESIKTVRPDVILLDLNLPNVEGLAVARQCRKDHSMRRVPIVAVTAYPLNYAREDALAAGCDDYIQKPINTRTLAKRLEELVAAKANLEVARNS